MNDKEPQIYKSYEITIPAQLQKKEFRFTVLEGKKPIEKDWTKRNYTFDSKALQDWIVMGKNYGVVCGYGNLLVIDLDHPSDELLREFVKIMPPTFTVRTGGGGYHFYYITDQPMPSKALDLPDGTHIDIQGKGKQVVGPNSVHPETKKTYVVIADRPIAHLSNEQFGQFFAKYFLEPQKRVEHEQLADEERLQELQNEILKKLDYVDKGQYILAHCPFHPPDNNPSFVIYKNTFLAIDFHDQKVYLLKDLAKKLGIVLKKPSKKPSSEINDLFEEDPYITRAKKLYEWNPYFYDTKTGYFYYFNSEEGIYRMVEDDELLTYYLDQLDPELKQSITQSTKKNRILQGMKFVGLMRKPEEPKKSWIKFKDVIVDFETGELIKPSPKYFFVNSIPHNFGSSDDVPTIDKLFESWVGKENKKLLYQIIAYSIYRDYPIHRIFILYGSGRNGKGSFQRLLARFLGADNIASTDLDRLENSRFEPANLYNKLVALCGETNFSVIKKSATLKSLSGQDYVAAEFKYKNQFKFINYAKIIISTNSLPMSLDTTDGFFSRMIIVDFPNVFDFGKDVINDIPEEEFENLGRVALKYLKELLNVGKFRSEGSIEEKRKRYEERANPLNVFISEYCERDADGFIPSTEFYNKFVSWMSREKPRFRIPNWRSEIKPILEAMGCETGVRKWVGGEQKRCIVGLKWKEDKVEELHVYEEIKRFEKMKDYLLSFIGDSEKYIVDMKKAVKTAFDLSDEEFDHLLQTMLHESLIYEIRPGFYARV